MSQPETWFLAQSGLSKLRLARWHHNNIAMLVNTKLRYVCIFKKVSESVVLKLD